MQQDNFLNEVIGRLRINESRISTLRERLLVTDSNMIEETKNLANEIQDIDKSIRELKLEIEKMKETIQDVIKTTSNFASQEDFKILEKYINMWSPLNFVTEKEVINLIKENA